MKLQWQLYDGERISFRENELEHVVLVCLTAEKIKYVLTECEGEIYVYFTQHATINPAYLIYLDGKTGSFGMEVCLQIAQNHYDNFELKELK